MEKFYFLQRLEKQFGWLKNVPILPQIIDEQLKIVTLLFRPAVFEKMIEVVKTVKSWEHVHTSYHKFGGLEFRIQGKEFAHIHGNGLIDILLTVKIRNYLVEKKWANQHHVFEESGWVSIYLSNKTEIYLVLKIIEFSFLYQKGIISVEQVFNQLINIENAEKEVLF